VQVQGSLPVPTEGSQPVPVACNQPVEEITQAGRYEKQYFYQAPCPAKLTQDFQDR